MANNLYDFQERFPETWATFMSTGYINPLEIFERRLFDADRPGDYREQAIDECLEHDESFTSTKNTLDTLVDRVLVVKCPRCGEPMDKWGGGGYPMATTYEFRCANEKCEPGIIGGRPTVLLTLANNAFDVRLPERAKDDDE